jgi:hypothetical protein
MNSLNDTPKTTTTTTSTIVTSYRLKLNQFQNKCDETTNDYKKLYHSRTSSLNNESFILNQNVNIIDDIDKQQQQQQYDRHLNQDDNEDDGGEIDDEVFDEAFINNENNNKEFNEKLKDQQYNQTSKKKN